MSQAYGDKDTFRQDRAKHRVQAGGKHDVWPVDEDESLHAWQISNVQMLQAAIPAVSTGQTGFIKPRHASSSHLKVGYVLKPTQSRNNI